MSRSILHGAAIGCGYFSANHLHAWQEVDGAEIVAVCDHRRDRAREYSMRFGIDGVWTDPGRMLAGTDLDFVDIVTRPETHRELVELAASQGLHVICQKPMAPGLDDGRLMVETCRAAGVHFMVHENFRWQLPMRAVREASEEVGPLDFARISFRTGFDVYSRQPYLARDERFIVYDLGVHLLDLTRFFVGEIERLHCEMSRVNPRIRGEDVATILLRARNGAQVVVDLSYGSKPVEDHFPQTLVLLEGRHGSVDLGPDFRLSVRSPTGRDERVVTPVKRDWTTPPGEAIQDSVVHLQQHWVDCLRGDRTPETSGDDNLKTLELVFGAYESAETGAPFRPGEAG